MTHDTRPSAAQVIHPTACTTLKALSLRQALVALSTSLHCGRQDVENEPGALPAPAGHPAFAPGALAPRGQPQPNAQIQALNMLPASARVLGHAQWPTRGRRCEPGTRGPTRTLRHVCTRFQNSVCSKPQVHTDAPNSSAPTQRSPLGPPRLLPETGPTVWNGPTPDAASLPSRGHPTLRRGAPAQEIPTLDYPAPRTSSLPS